MKKRILALLTCMALMLGMFPATAMAAQKQIKEIKISDITAPVKDANPDTTASVATYASSGSEAYTRDSVSGTTVTWYEISGKDKDHVTKADLTDTSKMNSTDVFKLGKTYACEIKVQIESGSFIVASDVSGKVNNATSYSMNTSDTDGTAVPICQDGGATAVLYAVYELPAVTNVNVTTSLPCKNINIVPTEPYSVTFTKAGSASVSGNYYAWYELTEEQYKAGQRTTNKPMSLDDRTGDKFKSGYYYSLAITIAANSGYTISDDITATVNGTTDTRFTIAQDKKTAVLTAVYAPSAVYNVDVSVTDPKIGATADYKPTAKITTKGTASLAGAYWYKVPVDKNYKNRSNWVEMKENEKFEKGYYYIFSALYSANNDYVVSNAATATVNDGKENSDLTKLQMESITDFDTEKLLVVTALFDPLKDEPVTPADKSDSASPKTGDSDSDMLGLWALLAIASLGAVGAVGYRRKQER